MAGIPDDIRKAAEEAWRLARKHDNLEASTDAIARVIMKERERTARIMRSTVDNVSRLVAAGKL